MPELSFALELKNLSDAGTFEGFASIYGARDLVDDVVDPGAFSTTLTKRGATRPLLWSHDPAAPVGLCELTDSSAGLVVKGTLDLDTSSGRDCYSRVRKKIASGLSIGYRSLRDQVKDGIRHLLEVDLFEISLCCFPACPGAQVVRVKSQLNSVRDYEQWLRQSGGFSKSEARRLAAHGWHGPDDDDDSDDDLLAWLRAQKAAALAP